MSVKAMKSRLFKIDSPHVASFYCLEETAASLSNGRAVVFLHGLGENRTGLNYLYHELSLGLRDEAFSVYRFDLGGCGESTLPLSINTWKGQVDAIRCCLAKYSSVHFVTRGISSLLIPDDLNSVSISLGPCTYSFFQQQYSQISVEEHQELWIPHGEQPMDAPMEYFWYTLGVEAGCLGGFHLQKVFLKELETNMSSSKANWKAIYGGNKWPFPLPVDAHHFPVCHPLFLFQKDRKILLNALIEILN